MQDPKARIAFVVPSLRMGGAERVAVVLCDAWARLGYDVTLVTFDSPEHDFFTPLPQVKRQFLSMYTSNDCGFLKLVSFNLKRLCRLRRCLKDIAPDVVVSFMDHTNILTLLSTRGLNLRVIISERTYPPFFKRRFIYEMLRKISYRFCEKLVVQTSMTAHWAEGLLPKDRVHVLANPLRDDFCPTTSRPQERILLSMGRLEKEKGFDLLIEACPPVFEKHKDWSLHIVGAGQEAPFLQKQIEDLGLSHNVVLRGATKTPEDSYKEASLFVLCSRVEGFPNALLEAMACGLPVISFDCTAGPRDLISHEVSGLLVPAQDIDSLSQALMRLMDDPDLRASYGQAAYEASKAYHRTTIAKQWLEVLGV